MALRIKSKWFKKDKDSFSDSALKENGQALAFICWRLALDRAINLHGEDFVYDSDQQRVYVIGEYLAFFVQVADRHVYPRLNEHARTVFITAFAEKLAEHMQDNCQDLFGMADYKGPFIGLLNSRSASYAQYDYSDETGPSYGMLRSFGMNVQKVMGDEHHVNRWVIDQVMEIDGPETLEKLIKAIDDLFDY